MNRWRTSRSRSFINAFSGLLFNLSKEPNFLVQLIIAMIVIVAGIIFPLNRYDWILILLSVGAVLSAEAMNTAVEKICDRFTEESDPVVRRVKDSAAAAVLIISITAAVIGVLVFWPYVEGLF